METVRNTVISEIAVNEERTERYSYKRTWSRSKNPKLACILSKFPVSNEPGVMDLTTMLISNELFELGEYDGFILVNLTSEISPENHLSDNDFSEENNRAILKAFNDEQVQKIIIAVGSIIKNNKDVSGLIDKIIGQLSDERQAIVEVLTGKNGPVHPLSTEARRQGGWNLAKLVS